jgi:hypothetical protein
MSNWLWLAVFEHLEIMRWRGGHFDQPGGSGGLNSLESIEPEISIIESALQTVRLRFQLLHLPENVACRTPSAFWAMSCRVLDLRPVPAQAGDFRDAKHSFLNFHSILRTFISFCMFMVLLIGSPKVLHVQLSQEWSPLAHSFSAMPAVTSSQGLLDMQRK